MRNFEAGERVIYNSPAPTDQRNGKKGEIVGEGDGSSSRVTIFVVKFDDPSIGTMPCADACLTLDNYPDQQQDAGIPVYAEVMTDHTPATQVMELPVMAESLLYSPISITFDKERYIGYALAVQQRYAGLVLTVDNEAEIKTLNTTLSKVVKDINSERIRIEKELNAPIKQLKADVDEVIKIITDTQLELKKQLDESVNEKRNKKRNEVQLILDGFKQSSNLPADYLARVTLKDEYLNASMSMKKIKEDIGAQVAQLDEDYDNEQKAKQADVDLARNREMMYNALCAAFPDVQLMLSDLTHVNMQDFAAHFTAKRTEQQAQPATPDPVPQFAPVPTFELPPLVEPVEQVELVTSALEMPPVIEPHFSTEEIYAIDVRVTHPDGEVATMEAVLTLIDLAQAQGLTVELLTQL